MEEKARERAAPSLWVRTDRPLCSFSSSFLLPKAEAVPRLVSIESNHVGMSPCDTWGVCGVAGVPGEGRLATWREAKVAQPELWPSSPGPALISRPGWLSLAGTFTNVPTVASAQPLGGHCLCPSFMDLEPKLGLRGLATSRQPGPALVLGPPPAPYTHTQLVLCLCPETHTQGRTGDFRKSGITSSFFLPPEPSEQSYLMSLGLSVGHQQGSRTIAVSFPALSPRLSHPICYLGSIPSVPPAESANHIAWMRNS